MKYKLDLDDELYDFDGWAFVHFHTTAPGFAFADGLNRLYNYRLARIDDMVLDDVQWPFYRHEDGVRHLRFFLIERPVGATAAPWDPTDKLLIIKGENAAQEASLIYSDFTAAAKYDDGDLLAREHAELMDTLLSNFTMANLLDFTTTPASRKATKERSLVMQHCDALLAYIEQKHLDLSDEERLRLETKVKKI